MSDPFKRFDTGEKDALICTLIRLGADVNYQNPDFYVASAKLGLRSFLKCLCAHTKYIPNPSRLLFTAVTNNQASILDFLVTEIQCDVSDGSKQYAAVRHQALDVLLYLVNLSSFITEEAFMLAVRRNLARIVGELIRVGRELDSRLAA
ncbi:hypothetical protein HDV00_007938 [Rhizophlyctis rosea]|nr:hypothetical protein HDV00_007938 [Rhizophlyctis rosea]